MKKRIMNIIGSLTAKFAALALALVCAGNVWATTVATEAELRAAIASGGTVTLGGNIALTQGEIAVSNTVTLDLATYTISSPTNVFRIAANGNFTVNAAATNPGGISVPTNRCCVYTSYGWDPGAKTVVLNGGVFTGNCVFNWAASALSAYVSYENYGLAVDGAGSGEKAVPTSVTINGGTFTGGYELGNVGAYRCYYFTVNGGTFEKGLDCADTRYCSIGVTTTCKAYFNGGRYRDRYPTFRKKKQGLSVVDDPGKVFIGTTTHTNSYYIAGGYYVNAYDRSACEVTGTYAGAAVQSSYLIFLTTGYPQRWYNPSDTWYFLTEDDAEDVGATNVIHINGENGAGAQIQSTTASRSSAARLASSKGALLAAPKSAASPAVASARLLSAAPARLLTTASAPADVITTRPAGTKLGEIKVVGNDGHTYITQNASLLSGTVFKTELDADRIDACYFFGPASSPYITENDGSDDETVYAAIHKRVSDAMESGLSGADEEAALLALMELSFTAEERELLLANAETLAYESYKITKDCFSGKANGTYGLNFEGGGMAVISCVYNNPTLATSDADPFESDPHLTWDLSLVVSFDKAVSADSVRFWWAAGGSNTVGDGHLKDSGTSVGALAANEVLSLSLGSGNKFDTFFLLGNGKDALLDLIDGFGLCLVDIPLVAVSKAIETFFVSCQEVLLPLVTYGTEAMSILVLVDRATLVIREGNISACLRSNAVALKGTISIDQSMVWQEGRHSILVVALQVLAPNTSVLLAVQHEGQLARGEVATFDIDNLSTLCIVEVKDVLSGNFGIVTPQILTIVVATRQHVANVPEPLDLYAAVTTEPTSDNGTLATSLHIARVVAVDNASSRTTVPNNTNQGAAVVALSFYIALVTYILECYPA